MVYHKGRTRLFADPRAVQDSYTDYSADPMDLQYSADLKVVQAYGADPRVVQDLHSDYSADQGSCNFCLTSKSSVMQYT